MNRYQKEQPKYINAQERVMDMKNDNSRQNTHCTTQIKTFTNNKRKNTNMNQEDTNKRKRNNKNIGKKRWTSIERK